MGILHGRDLFSPKWITALVSDSGNRLWIVPIKYPIDNWFIAKINRSLYVFEISPRAVKTYYATGVKALKFLFYDTTHCQPLRTEQLDELRRFLTKNNLKRVDEKGMNIFRYLKGKENRDTKEHDLTELIEDLQKETPTETTTGLVNFLRTIPDLHIAAPVEPISTFLDEEVLTTKPGFLGNLFSMYETLNEVRRRVTNTPVSGKTSWLKMAMVMGVVAAIIIFAGIGFEEGWFDASSLDLGLGGALTGGAAENPADPNYWTSRYSAEDLAIMVENGTLNKNDLPNEIWDIVKTQDIET